MNKSHAADCICALCESARKAMAPLLERHLNPAALRPLYEALREAALSLEAEGFSDRTPVMECILEALRLATLPASDSPTAPEKKPSSLAEAAICDGKPPSPTGEGAGFVITHAEIVDASLVKWADLKHGQWYQWRPKPSTWSSPAQANLGSCVPANWTNPDDTAEYRLCPPPQWWLDHQAEKMNERLKECVIDMSPEACAAREKREAEKMRDALAAVFPPPTREDAERAVAICGASLLLNPEGCIHTMRAHPEGGDYCVKCGEKQP